MCFISPTSVLDIFIQAHTFIQCGRVRSGELNLWSAVKRFEVHPIPLSMWRVWTSRSTGLSYRSLQMLVAGRNLSRSGTKLQLARALGEQPVRSAIVFICSLERRSERRRQSVCKCLCTCSLCVFTFFHLAGSFYPKRHTRKSFSKSA